MAQNPNVTVQQFFSKHEPCDLSNREMYLRFFFANTLVVIVIARAVCFSFNPQPICVLTDLYATKTDLSVPTVVMTNIVFQLHPTTHTLHFTLYTHYTSRLSVSIAYDPSLSQNLLAVITERLCSIVSVKNLFELIFCITGSFYTLVYLMQVSML